MSDSMFPIIIYREDPDENYEDGNFIFISDPSELPKGVPFRVIKCKAYSSDIPSIRRAFELGKSIFTGK